MSKETIELLKLILEFTGDLIWPSVVIVFLYLFKNDLRSLIENARRVELPGGISIERVDEEIEKARELAREIETDRDPEVQGIIMDKGSKTETFANKRMKEVGLEPSPSGLNLSYYKHVAESDLRLSLIGLRLDFEIILRNLARGNNIPPGNNEPIRKIITRLFENGKLTSKQYEFVNTILIITNAALNGAPITKEQVYEVLGISQVLVDDFIAWLNWGFMKEGSS